MGLREEPEADRRVLASLHAEGEGLPERRDAWDARPWRHSDVGEGQYCPAGEDRCRSTQDPAADRECQPESGAAGLGTVQGSAVILRAWHARSRRCDAAVERR